MRSHCRSGQGEIAFADWIGGRAPDDHRCRNRLTGRGAAVSCRSPRRRSDAKTAADKRDNAMLICALAGRGGVARQMAAATGAATS